MQGVQFKPRISATLGVIAGVALFVYLGMWQAGKADRRSAEIAQHEQRGRLGPYQVSPTVIGAEQIQDAPVAVRGTFEADKQFYIDNRQEDGKPGIHVITPLRIEGSQTRVLVNRGWVGWGSSRGQIPSVDIPTGEVQINGIAAVPSTKKFFLMPDHEDANPKLWTRLDLQRYGKLYVEPIQPFVILQNPDSGAAGSGKGPTLVRRWPPPEDRVAMHQSYSMQWFGMAAALLIFYVVASLRKRNQP